MKQTVKRTSWLPVFLGSIALASTAFLAACNKTKDILPKSSQQAHINNETKFASKEYGVKGSPRITTKKKVRKGGGRYQIGKPYKIRGRWYKPKLDPGYNKIGLASWYGPNFHGRLTANGEIYDQYSLSAAHPTMPLPSYARVTNLENGSSVTVRVNDRGPFAKGRIIDLSARAAKLLNYESKGLAKVRVKYLGKARMDGLDERKLMASYKPPKGKLGIVPGASFPGTLFAKKADPEPEFVTAFNRVVVPEERPTITDHYGGIPIVVGESPRAPRRLLQPLAYGADNAGLNKSDPVFDSVLSEAEFYLGSFTNLEEVDEIRQAFEGLGKFSIESAEMEGEFVHSISLTAKVLDRNNIIEVSRKLGLTSAFEVR